MGRETERKRERESSDIFYALFDQEFHKKKSRVQNGNDQLKNSCKEIPKIYETKKII